MLPQKRWQEALDVQDACNLSGVLKSFAHMIDDVWAEAREVGQATEYFNQHPIVRLWIDKLCHLARIQVWQGAEAERHIWAAYDEAHAHIKATIDAHGVQP